MQEQTGVDGEKQPGQFGMRSMLLVVTAVAVLFAMTASMGCGGIVLFGIFTGIGIGIYFEKYAAVGVAAVFLGLLCVCLFPAVQKQRAVADRVACQSNLHQIAIAMHQYNDLYGSLPPAYLADENGKPMHSWRVLLLPFLGEQKLYRQYDFSEPWDGPNNRRLAEHMPQVFACQLDRHRRVQDTSYVVVTGKDTVFAGARAMTLSELAAADGTSFTLLVAECAESGIGWMEPRDLRLNRIAPTLNDRSGKPSLRSNHNGEVNVAMADASTRCILDRVEARVLRALLTAEGGEEESEY